MESPLSQPETGLSKPGISSGGYIKKLLRTYQVSQRLYPGYQRVPGLCPSLLGRLGRFYAQRQQRSKGLQRTSILH
jgi:hypothetical protein